MEAMVEYSLQVFLSYTRQFVLNHQNTRPSCHISLEWNAAQETHGAREGCQVPTEQGKGVCHMIIMLFVAQCTHSPGAIKDHHPVLQGDGHCQHCFCAPCVINLPPDFLKGLCNPNRLQLSRNLRDSPGFLEFVPGPGTLRQLSRKSAYPSSFAKKTTKGV